MIDVLIADPRDIFQLLTGAFAPQESESPPRNSQRTKAQAVFELSVTIQQTRLRLEAAEKAKKIDNTERRNNKTYAEYRAESAAIHAKQMAKYGAPVGAKVPMSYFL